MKKSHHQPRYRRYGSLADSSLEIPQRADVKIAVGYEREPLDLASPSKLIRSLSLTLGKVHQDVLAEDLGLGVRAVRLQRASLRDRDRLGLSVYGSRRRVDKVLAAVVFHRLRIVRTSGRLQRTRWISLVNSRAIG